jgi:hypothetical protein
MIGHFIVFLKIFFFQYKTEILLSFIFFYCIFLCFIVFLLSFWPQNQSERKHRVKVDRALRQF